MTIMPLKNMHPNPAPQRGLSLVEILGALAIGAIMVTGLASLMNSSLDDVKGQQAAYYQSQIASAGQKYIAANSGALRTSLPTAASLQAVNVQQLINAKLLSASTGARNVYGQTPCLLIRQPDPAGRPGQFDALLATSGGDPIPERLIAMVAAGAGVGGGYISANDAGTARGASWSSSTAAYRGAACNGASALSGGSGDGGRLASNLFFDGPGQSATDFLHRVAVPGRPELNSMNVPLRMANAALVASGASCLNALGDAEPGLALDAASRELMLCGADGRWRATSQWKAPVANYAALPPAAASKSGDVRMIMDKALAFTFNGAQWVPLAVDQNGNMTVPGTLSATNLHANADITADGTIQAVGDIKTKASVKADLDMVAEGTVKGYEMHAKRRVLTEGLDVTDWASTPAISIYDNTFTPGQACNYPIIDNYGVPTIAYPYGTVVTDGQHMPLICGLDKTLRYANGTYTP